MDRVGRPGEIDTTKRYHFRPSRAAIINRRQHLFHEVFASEIFRSR